MGASFLRHILGEIRLTQKERLEEIRKRHEEERKRQSIIRHRIILGVAALIALLLVILIIIGCVRAVSNIIENRRLEQERIAAEQTAATPEPTPSYTIDPNVISVDYYADSAFVGNSFADDLFMYDLIENADYFTKTGLSVDEAMTEKTSTGKVPIVEEFNGGKKYKKIFMVFGENELGWISGESFAEQYGELIDKVQEYQPQSEIYLLGITPVTKKASEANIDNTNNEQIKVYNELIKQLAARKNSTYADLYKAVADSEGNLPVGAATDGVHFGKDYYEKCLLYIQNNYQ